jgi:hypothetical protein
VLLFHPRSRFNEWRLSLATARLPPIQSVANSDIIGKNFVLVNMT